METSPPAVVLTVTGGRPHHRRALTGGRQPDRGILAVWPDGVIVWSYDRLRGGPPYCMARIDPASVARTVDAVSRGGRWVSEWRFGPGARWTRLTARIGLEPIIDVGSWHELAEYDRDVV